MKYKFVPAAVMMIILIGGAECVSLAQVEETKKYEVGLLFTSLSIREDFHPRTEPGIGGRFTYNVDDNLAFEAEGNFFLDSDESNAFRTGGRATAGFFGIKIGKRYRKFGIFAKGRPGLISFSQGTVDFSLINTTPGASFPIEVHPRRLTHFAADLGGVLELYPSRRLVTRFDFGDTVMRFGQITMNSFTMIAPGSFVPSPFTLPGKTTHNFQFSASVGFRF